MAPSSAFDRVPPSPSAQFLGWKLIAEDPASGTVEVSYETNDQMMNLHGTVQGGFVAAMLDDIMGRALFSMTDGTVVPMSVQMQVSFVRAVKPGRVTGRSRVINKGRSVVLLEAELFDKDNKVLARSTSSAIPVEIK